MDYKLRAELKRYILSTINWDLHSIRDFPKSLDRPEILDELDILVGNNFDMIPPELIELKAIQWGYLGNLGRTLSLCASIVAGKKHREAHVVYNLKREVSKAALLEIDKQIELFMKQEPANRPQLIDMAKAVLATQDDNDLKEEVSVSTFFVLTQDNREYFFHDDTRVLATSRENEILRRLLSIFLLRNDIPPKVNTYIVPLHIDPDITRERFLEVYGKRSSLPLADIMLVGQEFWDLIGDDVRYKDVNDIYREVAYEKVTTIIDFLSVDSI